MIHEGYRRTSSDGIVIMICILAVLLLATVVTQGEEIHILADRIADLETRLAVLDQRMTETHEVFVQAGEIKRYILRTSKRTPKQATEIAYQIIATARMEGLDPSLLAGVARQESGFNPAAVGALGERGLLQVRPSTFPSWHSGDIGDWRATLEAGARFLASCFRRFRVPRVALAAYNAGPNRHIPRILELSGSYADRALAYGRAAKGGSR